jgi:hypothetical protein
MLFFIFLFIIFLAFLSIKRYKTFFNPFTLSLQYPLLFLTIPQIILVILGDGEDSLLSDVVILLYILFLYLGTFFKIPYLKIYSFKNTKIIVFCSFVLAVVIFIPLLPMLLKYGISFRGLREFYEEVVFSAYASFYEVFKTLLLILIIILFVWKRKITIVLICLIFILFFSGSKMAILSTMIILVTMYEEYKRVNYKVLFISSILVFVLLLFYHFSQTLQNQNKNIFDTALSYFDVYRQQTMALELFVSGKMDYYYGEIALSSWYKVIPRFIWESKPKDFGFALLNYAIYPEFSSDGYMPSFGLAYSFADFGFASIIFSGFFAGMLKNYFYRMFYNSKKDVVPFLLYILDFNIVLCTLFFIFLFIIFLAFQSKAI